MKITGKAIDRPLIVSLITIFIVVAGVISTIFLPFELFPEVDAPIVFVKVQYKGASPSEIEYQINNKIEEEVQGLDDVDDITSMAYQDFGQIIVKFTSGSDRNDKKREVSDTVDSILSELPSDIETPVISSLDISRTPIINVLVYGKRDGTKDDYIALKDIAEEVEDVFNERISGISKILIFGGLEREISVFVDPMQLWKKNISLSSLISFFRGGGIDTPGGNISLGPRDYPIRVLGSFGSADEVENTVFTYSSNGKPVYLKDLGKIVSGTAKATSFARYNGKPAVALSIIKQSDANTLKVSSSVYKVISEIEKSKRLPKGVKLAVVGDQSNEIRVRLSELSNSALQGIAVVFLILSFGLGFRNALIATLAVPFCFLFALTGLLLFGDGINNIVQFALIVIIGIVVDGAIVVIENVYRHRKMGKDRIKAAKEGTNEVGTSIISAVLTTMAAFAPMFFMGGIVGDVMSYIPKTVMLALTGSIIFDHLVIPVICSRFLGVSDGDSFAIRLVKKNARLLSDKFKNQTIKSIIKGPFKALFASYTNTLRLAVSNKLKVIIITFVCFVGGILLLRTLGAEYFPGIDLGKVYINIELPKGYNVEGTNEIVRKIESIIDKYRISEEGEELASGPKIIKYYATTVGSTGANISGGTGTQSISRGPNIGRIDIDILAAEKREIGVDAFISDLRKELTQNISSDARIVVQKPAFGPPTAAPINIVILGDDIKVLKQLAKRAEKIIKQIPATIDVQNDYGVGRAEIQLVIDRQRAQKYDLSVKRIQDFMYVLNNGYELARYQYGSKDIEIRLRIDEAYNKRIEDLSQLTIFSEKLKKPILITQVADIKLEGGLSYIRHEDTRRAIVVSGDVDKTQRASGDVAKQVIAVLSDSSIFSLPRGYSMRFRGENEDRDESFEDLFYAFMVGFLVIYFIIVIQFNSFIQPAAVMVTVALSVVGIAVSLFLSGGKLGIIVMFGAVSLTGIVVNDAIVFVSYINLLRQREKGLIDAVIEAGETRFRPIILTTLTTIGGLLPLALALGGTRAFWSPMGWTIIGGLAVATFQTLIVIPVVYLIIEQSKTKALARYNDVLSYTRGKFGIFTAKITNRYFKD